MTTLERVRVPWSGGVGGPGVSTFYFLNAASSFAALHDFFTTFVGMVPAGISWTFYGAGDSINAETGAITGSWSATGQPVVLATAPGVYAAPAGLIAGWKTTTIVSSHRVRGRTFIVPLIRDALDDKGTISDTVVSNVQTAGAALIAASLDNLQVWSRPRSATPSWTDVHGKVHAAKAARAGVAATVHECVVPDKAMVLRSRRD